MQKCRNAGSKESKESRKLGGDSSVSNDVNLENNLYEYRNGNDFDIR